MLRLMVQDSCDAAPAAAVDEEPAPKKTRAEICRAAGVGSAAARKQKREGAQSEAAPRGSASSHSASACSMALVPLASSKLSLFSDTRLHHEVYSLLPRPLKKPVSTNLESDILNSTCSLINKSAMAEQIGTSVQTVTRRMRLLACCLMMMR